MCGNPEPSLQGGRIQRQRACGAPEPFQRIQSHGTCGGVGALLIREAGSGALPAGLAPQYIYSSIYSVYTIVAMVQT
jgi:hypothetical protein